MGRVAVHSLRNWKSHINLGAPSFSAFCVGSVGGRECNKDEPEGFRTYLNINFDAVPDFVEEMIVKETINAARAPACLPAHIPLLPWLPHSREGPAERSCPACLQRCGGS